MTNKIDTTQLAPEETRGMLASYIIGFAFSIGLTLVAYLGVTHNWFSNGTPSIALLVLAILQLVVQLFFFLHVGRETRPRWRLFTLFLAITVILIVVIGSIWIMYNLNYRMLPSEMERYMQRQDGGI